MMQFDREQQIKADHSYRLAGNSCKNCKHKGVGVKPISGDMFRFCGRFQSEGGIFEIDDSFICDQHEEQP